ncbi:malate dehydrogenase (quinone) [Nocardia yunnanensis]|uniref:Probable malate:quinone oxidoreductase n=1 Tax=Nocardia yunnanensis TaxID=2382165 RepID=A0A386ZCW4_9NOCA|nr:malate dehydrogenase (quinone) [Nocardia yunnanensis]AYF75440.1 malate dehydrogenase (quinone) [Nocardia yunnanensis]
MNAHREPPESSTGPEIFDVVLIGGGIMSATLGAMIAALQPDWSVALLERLDRVGAESSAAWNNAGTGHSGYCELNYMPDPDDAGKAAEIASLFAVSRRFWAGLAERGTLADTGFVTATPHMDVVFGERDVAYLRQRFETLRALPAFAELRYSEDPEVIAEWAPLIMQGRAPGEPVAATRFEGGTDVDFGSLTGSLVDAMTEAGARVRTGHQVTRLRQGGDGVWTVSGHDRNTKRRFTIRARFVFVGAGGYALRLLQRARLPEVRGYGVLPVGAQFLRTDNPAVVARHQAKVYSQAAVGAPPMSVPHLDTRHVDGNSSLLFGPYATFSTRLLTHGRLTDVFTTLRWSNLAVLAAAIFLDLSLIRYLIRELLSTRRRKFAQLQRFYPHANPADWHLIRAGQRAQLVKPHPTRIGILTMGTELITSTDGTIAGLLGASPGASTAPAIMLDLLTRCFPHHLSAWQPTLHHLALTPTRQEAPPVPEPGTPG